MSGTPGGRLEAIKICGITAVEDALQAAGAGATHLGFVFAPSPRRVEAAAAARIAGALPEGVQRVGVFVNESLERMGSIAREAALTMVQLHGDEPPELVAEVEARLGLPVIRALRVRDGDPRRAIEGALASPSATILLEPLVAGARGGTGASLDLALAREIVAALPGRRVLLAGGLGPQNVRRAVQAVRPWGVDASSRLEASPGRKDPALVRSFVEEAKRA